MGKLMPDKGPTAEQRRMMAEQKKEMERLKAEEEKRKDALKRARMGRASLISGDERGVKDTLG